MHDDRTLRSVQNTSPLLGLSSLAPYPSLVHHHMQPASTSADACGSGPAAKRARVEEALQQHAPREQLLVSELMGWGSSSHEPLSALGTSAVPNGSTDFRALFARKTSQQQQQQQQGAAAAAAFHRTASAATTGLRTFVDLTSHSAAAPEDLGRQEVLGALRAAYNTAGAGTQSGMARGASQHAWPGIHDATGSAGVGAARLGAPGTSGAAATVTAAAAAVAGGALEDLIPEQLPVDWVIKRSITFTSSARFTIHDKAQQAPPRTRWRALQGVVNSDLDSSGDEVAQYLACQLSWRHPEAPLDSSALAAARSASTAAASAAGGGGGGTALANATSGVAGGGAGGGAGLLAQRLAAWRGALHSLYSTYRGGDCNVFYVINLAGRNPFVALFTYNGVRGSNELCAVVSQSSRILRGRMLAAGVPFTMPLERAANAVCAGPGAGVGADTGASERAGGFEAAALRPAGPQDEDDADADAGLCDVRPQAGPSSSSALLPGFSVIDNSRESLLLLRGPRAVHGLYDFLLNDTSYPGLGGRTVILAGGGGGGAGPGDELSDLPLLLAPVPFDGGVVWRPAIKALTLNCKLAGDAPDMAPAATATALQSPAAGDLDGLVSGLHVLQISGPLPPWTARRLCSLMARLQPSGYSASLETEPCSITLNSRVIEARPGSDGDGGEAPAPRHHAPQQPTFAQGGALTLEELLAWQQPAALPGGRPMKCVTCSCNRRLSARV